MENFQPTHAIRFATGEVLKVQLVDGVAYTREEWDSGNRSDWTINDDNEWVFQGRVTEQPFAIELNVHIEEIKAGDELDLTAPNKKCYLVNNDGERKYVVRR